MKTIGVFLGISLLMGMPVSAGEKRTIDQGTFSIYFMKEKVGYEEFEWREAGLGYELEVRGRMTKPIPVEIKRLTIEVSQSFIPTRFYFQGVISGMEQTVISDISDGHVKNIVQIAGQKHKTQEKIRRDAFLLPNPVFSSYMIITRKYRCAPGEEMQLSAYIIPQVEIPFVLKTDEEDKCRLLMNISSSVIELQTNPDGHLLEVRIPAQNLTAELD